MALVEDGSVRVGWPGAPGWTTNRERLVGSACCANTGSDNTTRESMLAANTLFTTHVSFLLSTSYCFILLHSGSKSAVCCLRIVLTLHDYVTPDFSLRSFGTPQADARY